MIISTCSFFVGNASIPNNQIGRQNIAVQGIYESYEVLHSTLELNTGAQMLGPGEHRFAFSFVVDSTATPYERCAL